MNNTNISGGSFNSKDLLPNSIELDTISYIDETGDLIYLQSRVDNRIYVVIYNIPEALRNYLLLISVEYQDDDDFCHYMLRFIPHTLVKQMLVMHG